jgi:hypothetical protein
MSNHLRFAVLLVLAAVFGAGCSVFPGLKVLSGQDTTAVEGERTIENIQLVMADKTGNTDPAVLEAGNRIEAALSNTVDVVEMRKDLTQDVFNVAILIEPFATNATQLEVLNTLKRVVELVWQGSVRQSEGADILTVQVVQPYQFPTLDHGDSYIGAVALTAEIERLDALNYLAGRPNDLQAFVDLIVAEKLVWDQPTQFVVYTGVPNHPVFMISQLTAATQTQ